MIREEEMCEGRKELTVMISVASHLRQKRKIKAIPCFTRLRGHYMGDQFGQELFRGTLRRFMCRGFAYETSITCKK
jgi:hypothetical protein